MERWEKHVRARIERHIDSVREREEDMILTFCHGCQSPIEMMLAADLAYVTVFGVRIDLCGDDGIILFEDQARFNINKSYRIELWKQVAIEAYRVDFLVLARFKDTGSLDRDLIKIVIECDGHAFHERTKEQAARDRKRDRTLTAAGYRVFRFTGSEIFRRASECAGEIQSFLEDAALADHFAALDSASEE